MRRAPGAERSGGLVPRIDVDEDGARRRLGRPDPVSSGEGKG